MTPQAKESQAPAPADNVLALIPAYNEAPAVGAVVAATRRHLPVLVVDDGSTDETAVLAERSGARLLRQTPNQGKGAALKAGFEWALGEAYAAVLTIDADGQHDPAEIPLFLDRYRERSEDLIIGAREFGQMPFSRRFANTTGRWLFSAAVGQNVPDNQSGYRLISRRLVQAMQAHPEQGFEFEVEMIVACLRSGWSLGWVPIQTIYQTEVSHINPVRHTLNFFRLVWQTWRRMRA